MTGKPRGPLIRIYMHHAKHIEELGWLTSLNRLIKQIQFKELKSPACLIAVHSFKRVMKICIVTGMRHWQDNRQTM